MGNYSNSVGNHTFFDPVFSLFILQKSFRTGTSTRLDDRVFSMCQLKYQPLAYSMLMIHPSLYRVDDLTDEVREQTSVCCKITHLFIYFNSHFGHFWVTFILLCELSGSVEHQRADHPSAQAAAALCGEAQQGRRFPHGCWNSMMLSVLLSSILVNICIYGWHMLCFLF